MAGGDCFLDQGCFKLNCRGGEVTFESLVIPVIGPGGELSTDTLMALGGMRRCPRDPNRRRVEVDIPAGFEIPQSADVKNHRRPL